VAGAIVRFAPQPRQGSVANVPISPPARGPVQRRSCPRNEMETSRRPRPGPNNVARCAGSRAYLCLVARRSAEKGRHGARRFLECLAPDPSTAPEWAKGSPRRAGKASRTPNEPAHRARVVNGSGNSIRRGFCRHPRPISGTCHAAAKTQNADGSPRGLSSPWSIKQLRAPSVPQQPYSSPAWQGRAVRARPDNKLLWRGQPRRLEFEEV